MRPDGELIRWRTVGVDEAMGEPALPFFIERTSGVTFRARCRQARPRSRRSRTSRSTPIPRRCRPGSAATRCRYECAREAEGSGASFSQGRAARSLWAN